MLEDAKPRTLEARLSVTPANVGTLCASIRVLAREGALRIDYLADPDAGWDEVAVELWQREHERLVTWVVGARSAGKSVPELPAWHAIEAGPVEDASAPSPAVAECSGDRASEIARRLRAAQVAAVLEMRAASHRLACAAPVAHPWATAAMLAATVTGMAACQSNGPMGVKPDAATDTNQTRDLGMGGGICATQIGPDALPSADVWPPAMADADDGGGAIDGEPTDTADAYVRVGGIC
jgi:hypothetical protein